MATRQGLDSNITNRLGADHQELFFAVKAEFDTSTIALWSGLDDLTIDGLDYTGAGSLMSISDVEESTELKSSGITIVISGMDSTVLAYALDELPMKPFASTILLVCVFPTNKHPLVCSSVFPQ